MYRGFRVGLSFLLFYAPSPSTFILCVIDFNIDKVFILFCVYISWYLQVRIHTRYRNSCILLVEQFQVF